MSGRASLLLLSNTCLAIVMDTFQSVYELRSDLKILIQWFSGEPENHLLCPSVHPILDIYTLAVNTATLYKMPHIPDE